MNRYNIFDAKQNNHPFASTTCCPDCNYHWHKRYATEFCPECGAKVIDTQGIGFNKTTDVMPRPFLPFLEKQLNRSMQRMGNYVAFTEKGHVPQTIIQCPKCSYRSPKFPEKELRICPRCRIAMKNMTPLKNVLYRIRYYWKQLRHRL